MYDNINHLKGWYFNLDGGCFLDQGHIIVLPCHSLTKPTKLKFGKKLSMLLHITVNIVTYICQCSNMYFLLSTKVWKLVKASAFAAKLYWLLLLKISTLKHVGLIE